MSGTPFLSHLDAALAALAGQPPEVAGNPALLELVALLGRPELALSWAEGIPSAKRRRDVLFSLGVALLPTAPEPARRMLFRSLLAAAAVSSQEEQFPDLALRRMAAELSRRNEFWPLAAALPELGDEEMCAALMEGALRGMAARESGFPAEALPARPWNKLDSLNFAGPDTKPAGTCPPPEADPRGSLAAFFRLFWPAWSRLEPQRRCRLLLLVAEGMDPEARVPVLHSWLLEAVKPLVEQLSGISAARDEASKLALLLARAGLTVEALGVIAHGPTYPWVLAEAAGYIAFYQDAASAQRALATLALEDWVVPYGLVSIAYGTATARLPRETIFWAEAEPSLLARNRTRKRLLLRLLKEAWECARSLDSDYERGERSRQVLVALASLGFRQEADKFITTLSQEEGWALRGFARALFAHECAGRPHAKAPERLLAELGEPTSWLWREGLYWWLSTWLAGRTCREAGCSQERRERCRRSLLGQVRRLNPEEIPHLGNAADTRLCHQAALFCARCGKIGQALEFCRCYAPDGKAPSADTLAAVLQEWVGSLSSESADALWPQLVAAAPASWKDGLELALEPGLRRALKRGFYRALLAAGRVEEALEFRSEVGWVGMFNLSVFPETLDAALEAARRRRGDLARLGESLFWGERALNPASGSAWATAALGYLYALLPARSPEALRCRAGWATLLEHAVLIDTLDEAYRWLVQALAWSAQDLSGDVRGDLARELETLLLLAQPDGEEGVGRDPGPLVWAEFAEGFAVLGVAGSARAALEMLRRSFATCWEQYEVRARAAFAFPPLSPAVESLAGKEHRLSAEAEQLAREVLDGLEGIHLSAYEPGRYYALFRGAVAPWVRQEYCWRAIGALRQKEPARTAQLVRLLEEAVNLAPQYRFEALHTVMSVAATAEGRQYCYRPRYKAMFASEFWRSGTYGPIFHADDHLPGEPPNLGLLAAAAGKMLEAGARAGHEEFWLRLAAFSPLIGKLNLAEEVWRRMETFLARRLVPCSLGT